MSAIRLLRWLTCVALFLAPLGMIGTAPAMAHDGVPAARHCADMDHPSKVPPSSPIDCMIACAGLPTQGGALVVRLVPPVSPEPRALASRLHGLHPEAATPPPRRT
jgi:hypothetical protein